MGLSPLEQEERNLRPEELQGISQEHAQFPLYIQGFVQNWLRGIELSIRLPKVSMCSADISSPNNCSIYKYAKSYWAPVGSEVQLILATLILALVTCNTMS